MTSYKVQVSNDSHTWLPSRNGTEEAVGARRGWHRAGDMGMALSARMGTWGQGGDSTGGAVISWGVMVAQGR